MIHDPCTEYHPIPPSPIPSVHSFPNPNPSNPLHSSTHKLGPEPQKDNKEEEPHAHPLVSRAIIVGPFSSCYTTAISRVISFAAPRQAIAAVSQRMREREREREKEAVEDSVGFVTRQFSASDPISGSTLNRRRIRTKRFPSAVMSASHHGSVSKDRLRAKTSAQPQSTTGVI
jgi:hypothetical protein